MKNYIIKFIHNLKNDLASMKCGFLTRAATYYDIGKLLLVQTFQYLFRALTVLSFQATSCSETLNAGADVVFTSSSNPD